MTTISGSVVYRDHTDPPADPMLRLFAYEHLQRDDLRALSMRFSDFAHELVAAIPRGPERTVALRKLLEAKDAAVRAVAIPDPHSPSSPQPKHLPSPATSHGGPMIGISHLGVHAGAKPGTVVGTLAAYDSTGKSLAVHF